jgi:hypothetical protein
MIHRDFPFVLADRRRLHFAFGTLLIAPQALSQDASMEVDAFSINYKSNILVTNINVMPSLICGVRETGELSGNARPAVVLKSSCSFFRRL